jgi:hypothetical protein
VLVNAPLISGYHKLYRVQDMVAPVTTMPIDFKFSTPMVTRDKTVVDSLAKSFSLKRKKVFKSSPCIDDSVYRYSRPRLIMNNTQTKIKSPLPGWADALYASMYNLSTGVITFGLSPEELRLAARRQTYSHNPFHARSMGGYSILTRYRTSTCPTEEVMETAELLAGLEQRELPYATRADLYPSAQEQWDELYVDTALIEGQHFDLKRKARQALSEYSGVSAQEYRDLIYKKVKALVTEPEDDLELLNSLLRNEESLRDPIMPDSMVGCDIHEDEDDYYDDEAVGLFLEGNLLV